LTVRRFRSEHSPGRLVSGTGGQAVSVAMLVSAAV